MELIIKKPYKKGVDKKSRFCADFGGGGGGDLLYITK